MPRKNPHPLIPVLNALDWRPIDLARSADVAQPTISYVLNGRRGGRFSPRTARRIMAAVAARAAERMKEGITVPAFRLALEDLIFAPGERA